MTPRNITKEFVDLLEQSGCTKVEFGTDSLSDVGLESLNKGFDFNKILEVDSLFSKSSIVYTHCIFIGAPGEDRQAIKQIFERMKLLKANQIFITLGIRIYENTPLYDRALADNIIDEKHNQIKPTFYIEPALLKGMDIFDYINDQVNTYDNCYLWWQLDKVRLKNLVLNAFSKINEINEEFFEY